MIYAKYASARGYGEDIGRTVACDYSRFYMQDEDLLGFEEIYGSSKVVLIDVEKSTQREVLEMDVVGEKILLSLASNLKEEGEEVLHFSGDRFLIVIKSSLCFDSLKERIEEILLSFQSSHNYLKYCVSFFMHGSALKISLSKKV